MAKNLLLNEGFVKADASKLPKVSYFMAYEFLVTDKRFIDPEVRGVKLTA